MRCVRDSAIDPHGWPRSAVDVEVVVVEPAPSVVVELARPDAAARHQTPLPAGGVDQRRPAARRHGCLLQRALIDEFHEVPVDGGGRTQTSPPANLPYRRRIAALLSELADCTVDPLARLHVPPCIRAFDAGEGRRAPYRGWVTSLGRHPLQRPAHDALAMFPSDPLSQTLRRAVTATRHALLSAATKRPFRRYSLSNTSARARFSIPPIGIPTNWSCLIASRRIVVERETAPSSTTRRNSCGRFSIISRIAWLS